MRTILLGKSLSVSPLDIQQRFFRYVVKSDNGCWFWVGARDRDGYGRFKLYGVSRGAHRVSYALQKPLTRMKDIHHTCTERSCVNPQHLQPIPRRKHVKLHK